MVIKIVETFTKQVLTTAGNRREYLYHTGICPKCGRVFTFSDRAFKAKRVKGCRICALKRKSR